MILAVDTEQAATKAAAEAIAAVTAAGRTPPPQMKLPPPPFEERMRKLAVEQTLLAEEAATEALTVPVKEAHRMLGEGYEGAGEPRASLPPEEVVPLLMRALQLNGYPTADSGLHSVWAFATGTTRFIFGNNRSEFVESAHQTAGSLPTSFYGVALHGQSWELEGGLNRVCGDDGWIATQLMRTVSSDGRRRRWQFELRKQRRPPDLGAWFVESIGSSNKDGVFDVDG